MVPFARSTLAASADPVLPGQRQLTADQLGQLGVRLENNLW